MDTSVIEYLRTKALTSESLYERLWARAELKELEETHDTDTDTVLLSDTDV